jgi:hypothetical protein
MSSTVPVATPVLDISVVAVPPPAVVAAVGPSAAADAGPVLNLTTLADALPVAAATVIAAPALAGAPAAAGAPVPAPHAAARPAKGRPTVWNATCTGVLTPYVRPYVDNLNAHRRGDKAAKQRNEDINSAIIDELGHACGWDRAHLLAVGPDNKRTAGVRRDPVDPSRMDYAAQQVFEGRQITWRRLLRQVRHTLQTKCSSLT